ncbi:unnamed protein product, partial [Meganyctiphanes norvegica]
MGMKVVRKILTIRKPDHIGRLIECLRLILGTCFEKNRRREVPGTENFYSSRRRKSFKKNMKYIRNISEYILALIFNVDAEKSEESIAAWRKALGPTKVSEARKEQPESLRAKFGDPHNDSHNALHGSDSPQSAEREIKFFFPNLTLESVLTGEVAKEYLSHAVSPTLVEGLTQLAKIRPEDPIIWLADWLLVNNPNKPLTD